MQVSLLEFKRFIAEASRSRYSYSSTQANLPEDLSRKIVRWGRKEIPDDVLFRDPEDPSFGRETEIHVTILYGLHDNKPDLARELVASQEPFEVKLGKVTVFDTNDKFDVVKIDVQGDGLFKLNKLLRSNCSFTSKFPKYHPHVTVAYARKGKGSPYGGDESFVNEKFLVEEIIFSSTTGKKYIMPLRGTESS